MAACNKQEMDIHITHKIQGIVEQMYNVNHFYYCSNNLFTHFKIPDCSHIATIEDYSIGSKKSK